MAYDSYKPTSVGPPVGRLMAVLVLAVVLTGGGYLLGRLTAPEPKAQPTPTPGIRYQNGVPVGFPTTARGAGDAAAWYQALLSQRTGEPRDQLHKLLEQLVVPESHSTVIDRVLPAPETEGNPNIWQFAPLRVWAEGVADGSQLPEGTRVQVKVYGVALIGARTDGQTTNERSALTGGFSVAPYVMQLHGGRWKFQAVDRAIDVPPPDLAGTLRDGSARNNQPLAEVLGPDSWIPNTP